eukprot:6836938-Pyramimonas_sp.AAC.1
MRLPCTNHAFSMSRAQDVWEPCPKFLGFVLDLSCSKSKFRACARESWVFPEDLFLGHPDA